MDLLNHPVGIISIVLFIVAYAFVMTEEITHLRKSKPVLFVAGIIWAMIAWVGVQTGNSYAVKKELMHAFDEFNQLMLFLLVAMTYINSMTERNVFEKLRSILLNQNFSYKKLFWITGFISFFLSPIADNLTTALTMCAVVLAVGKGNRNFTSISCVNIVVAANAGGAFSPFGDITTLMVWQAGYVEFFQFLKLFLPSLVNFIIPSFIMSFFIDGSADDVENPPVILKSGAITISCLFLVTIMTAISFKQFLALPPVFGMMFGLSLLQLYGYYLKRTFSAKSNINRDGSDQPFGIFKQIAQAEWDTLLFFYGVILCVAGLSKIGYLALINSALYDGLGFTLANSLMGIISALIDNIPVMFSVIQMHDATTMDLNQWLLITLTAGVGGSLLSIGSAPGVALMGQAKGVYTFSSHLRWTGVIFIGYVFSILTHLWISGML